MICYNMTAGANSTASKIVGGLLCGLGIVILLYAMSKFLQRTTSLLEKKPAGYHDIVGPITLGAVIITVFLVAFLIPVTTGE
jgi:uncharacterized membrane protein YidH (DUF202 family)